MAAVAPALPKTDLRCLGRRPAVGAGVGVVALGLGETAVGVSWATGVGDTAPADSPPEVEAEALLLLPELEVGEVLTLGLEWLVVVGVGTATVNQRCRTATLPARSGTVTTRACLPFFRRETLNVRCVAWILAAPVLSWPSSLTEIPEIASPGP
jgi:hypothetical protein